MKKIDYLIVGGSAAGTTAAEVIRGLKPEATITVLTDENHEQYSRVLLPHYTKRKIEREQVFLKKPQWYEQRKINLVKGVKAQKLDSKQRIVEASDGKQYQYEKLLLAIGGEVVELDVPGSDFENVLYLRTVEDGDKVINYAGSAKRAVSIGGGFICLDFVTSFKANGVDDLTILVKEPYFWAGKLDDLSSRVIENVLFKNGVKIVTNEETAQIFSSDTANLAGGLITKSGKRYECDVLGVGIGIMTDLEWLRDSGIKIDKSIITNEFLETNLPNVYAAGDCAQFFDVVFGLSHLVGTWANATTQGAAVGKTMAGQRTLFETASSYSDSFFEGSYTFIGMTSVEFADEVIPRGSVEAGKMTRIFVKRINNVVRIVGATVINNPVEVAPLTAVIKGRLDISKNKQRLGDIGFDLNDMLV